jgi:elongation factor Ts
VGLQSTAEPAKLAELGKQLAMHVAAANPSAVTVDAIDPALVARERQIFAEQARASGKPENIIEKMVEGRVRKFYEEAVLLEQVWVIDTDKRVKQVVEATAKELGASITITAFVRMALGEGIEKQESDLAAEVAKMTQG